MLMGPHDGGVDHRIFVVGIIRQGLEKPLPDPTLRPPAEPPMGVLPIAETFWKIAPRRTRPELPDHRFHENPVAQLAVTAHAPRPTRQKILDPAKLVVPQAIAPHRKPPQLKVPYESRFTRFENPVNDDTT